MTKVAFCFPGQGSLEVGMGREIAEAVPEAMEVYRIGSEATGMDLAQLCFEGPLDAKHQRNTLSGWRREGLPWEQC